MESSNPANAKAGKADKKARRAAKVSDRPSGSQDGLPQAANSSQRPAASSQQASTPRPRRQGGDASQQQKPVKKPADAVESAVASPNRWSEMFEDRSNVSLQDAKVAGVHPAMLALGLQIRNYEICGSQARCVAMLLAFKAVIKSYKTPEGTSLARHLSSHGLSPQIVFLKSCRSLSVTQANAIRDLKNTIAAIDPSVAEETAKQQLCRGIDTFIRERFTVADQVIAESVADLIEDRDVILTFAHSAVVKKSLLLSASRGTKFSVIVVDSGPLYEGKNMAITLSQSLPKNSVSYCHFASASRLIPRATKVILGVHALYANGKALSRIGTAGICTEAKHLHKPVVLLAETIKITERIALDSLAVNDLLHENHMDKESSSLSSLSPLFDLTDARDIDQVITEIGTTTPHNTSAFLRIKDS